MCTSMCSNFHHAPIAKGKSPSTNARFPPLDAGPLAAGLGPRHVANLAPLLPLRGRARHSPPSANITSWPRTGHLRYRIRWTRMSATAECLARPRCVRGRGYAPGWPLQRRRCNAAGRRYSSTGSPGPVRRAGARASQGTARRRALVPPLRVGSRLGHWRRRN